MTRLNRGPILLPNAKLGGWNGNEVELCRNRLKLIKVGLGCREKLAPNAPRQSLNYLRTIYRGKLLVELQSEVARLVGECLVRKLDVPGLPPLDHGLLSKKKIQDGLSWF